MIYLDLSATLSVFIKLVVDVSGDYTSLAYLRVSDKNQLEVIVSGSILERIVAVFHGLLLFF